jgi:hypothetical protein
MTDGELFRASMKPGPLAYEALDEREICGAWMPLAKTTCARGSGHKGQHLSAETLERRLEHGRERYANDPEYRERKRLKSFINGTINGGYALYNLTHRPVR